MSSLHLLVSSLLLGLTFSKRPNILLILTDDQDSELGGTEPLGAGRRLIKEAGVEFTNGFVTTPICCPSRASILTGRYQHNTAVRNNSIEGGCASAAWREGLEKKTFATALQEAGYRTMYAGKMVVRVFPKNNPIKVKKTQTKNS